MGNLPTNLTRIAKAAKRLPWLHLATLGAVLLAPSIVHAGPIATGVQNGTTEVTSVGKYIAEAAGAGMTLIGGGRVGYKVLNEDPHWGLSLGAALVGMGIAAVALAV